jgi:hypothetical protein
MNLGSNGYYPETRDSIRNLGSNGYYPETRDSIRKIKTDTIPNQGIASVK